MKEYIEREAALKEFEKVCNVCMALVNKPMCGDCSVADTIRKVKSIPAADVRPVVTGRWIKVPVLAPFEQDDFRCSECDSWPWWCGVTEEILPNFCPNCGAKMEES